MGNTDPIKEHRMRVEAEWKRAKDDLENEDFYDQLADNPSSKPPRDHNLELES
jgi:hypothetical protein